jgi:hypothetical protein
LTLKIAKFMQNSLLQRLASRRNLWAVKLLSPESINKLPEAIYGRLVHFEELLKSCQVNKKVLRAIEKEKAEIHSVEAQE